MGRTFVAGGILPLHTACSGCGGCGGILGFGADNLLTGWVGLVFWGVWLAFWGVFGWLFGGCLVGFLGGVWLAFWGVFGGVFGGCLGGCLGGWLYCAPVASRVSPRRASYFFLLRQKKVTKKKASHVRAASRSLALLAAFGTLANSLRSNSASVLIRTLLRCSARPNGGGYHTARPLRELRPNGLFASLTSRGLGCLISLPSLLSRARHAVPLRLIPHASLLITGNHKGCPYDLTPHSYGLTPHSSLLRPHSSFLTPHPKLVGG